MKKIAKVLVALLTVGIMAVPTFAATIGEDGISNTSDTTISIPKGIIIQNSGYDKSYSPEITYIFSIAPSTNLGAVTDSANISAPVFAGPDGGLTEGVELVFTPELVESEGTALNKQLVKNIELTVDLDKFENPGIYRYTITDVTPTENLYRAGIMRSADFDTTRELDVYVVRNSTSGKLEISGYVLLDEIPPVVVADTKKTPGYVIDGDIIETHTAGQDGEEGTADDVYTYSIGDDNSVDRYETYNVVITKQIDGNMADTTHQFPFTITLRDERVNTAPGAEEVPYEGIVFAGIVEEQLAEVSKSYAVGLADDKSCYIYGIAPYVSLSVIETNDTKLTYTLTTSDDSFTDETLQPNGQLGVTRKPVTDYLSRNSLTDVSKEVTNQGFDLEFTNTANAPSTTGFLMRVLPFIALAGLMGGALVVVRKIKVKKDEQ